MIACTICGLWYPHVGADRLDICPDCYRQNFAGAQPPLDIHSPMAREALEAYVRTPPPLTPRQRAAMAHLHAQWRRSMEDDL